MGNIFAAMLEALQSGLVWFLTWVKDQAFTLLTYFFSALGSLVPTDWKPTIAQACIMIAEIEPWVPLQFGMKMLFGYYGIKLSLNAIKWVLKAIPGVW